MYIVFDGHPNSGKMLHVHKIRKQDVYFKFEKDI